MMKIELHKEDTCSNVKLCHKCVMVNIILLCNHNNINTIHEQFPSTLVIVK